LPASDDDGFFKEHTYIYFNIAQMIFIDYSRDFATSIKKNEVKNIYKPQVAKLF
jgi:hypothetical protein